jgi:hypothetical protein
MNRRHIWQIAPFVLLLTSLAWWAHAQSAGETPATPAARASTAESTSDELGSTPYTRNSGSRTNVTPRGLGGGVSLNAQVTSTIRGQFSSQGRSQERMLEQQTQTLLDEYRASSDTRKRAGAKEDLTAVVNEHFALRQTLRQSELDELEKELNRLKTLHERRQNQQDQIVADRVESLLREADGLGWGSTSSRRGGVLHNVESTLPTMQTVAPADIFEYQH